MWQKGQDSGVTVAADRPQLLEGESASSARLVKQFQGGDLGAFSLLYDQYEGRVRRYLQYVLHDPSNAEDVAQQVFLKVFEALPAYRIGTQPFWHWLSRIARRAALDHLAKHARTDLAPPDVLDRRRDGVSLPRWGSHTEVHALIAELPLAQQQVLVLLYRYELTVRQAGEALDRTPESIRQLRHRALARLGFKLSERAAGVSGLVAERCGK